MDELRGDRATWQFDGESIHIRFHTGWSKDAMLKALGQATIPITAVSAVDFSPGEKRGRWALRLRLRDRADPYAAVGATLTARSEPLRLAGPAKTRMLADFWADQVAHAGRAAGAADAALPAVALGLVPPVPMHIRTSEGTAGFDGSTVRLTWAGASAGWRKRQAQRREFALSDLVGVEWVPSDGWEWGFLRILTRESPREPPGKPKHDLTCLRCNEGDESGATLLLAATITAHLWAAGAATEPPAAHPRELPAAEPPADHAVYEQLRQLGQLHADGILTDAEFAAKKAELLDRL